MSNVSPTAPTRPDDDAEPAFGEKGPPVIDADAGKSEAEKLDEAVADLQNDPA